MVPEKPAGNIILTSEVSHSTYRASLSSSVTKTIMFLKFMKYQQIDNNVISNNNNVVITTDNCTRQTPYVEYTSVDHCNIIPK